MALGSLLIQKQIDFSNGELMENITENSYFQYSIGMSGYQTELYFASSLLVEFSKRLTDALFGKINEMIIAYNAPDDPPGRGSCPDAAETDTAENNGTLILNAISAP